MPSLLSIQHSGRFVARRRARVDPSDQHAAPPAGPVGGHGVPAREPEEAPHLGHPQAIAAVAAADGGHRRWSCCWPSRCCPSQWGSFLGGRPTHHIVLLDDSFSMSDRRGETRRFDQAKDAIRRLGQSMLPPSRAAILSRSCGCRRAGQYGGGLRRISKRSPSIRASPSAWREKLKVDRTSRRQPPNPGRSWRPKSCSSCSAPIRASAA